MVGVEGHAPVPTFYGKKSPSICTLFVSETKSPEYNM